MSDLAPMDVAGRLPRLRERLGPAGCEALVVTSLPNVRYLTGFTGSAGTVVVTPASATLVTDSRYTDQAAAELADAGVAADVVTARAAEHHDTVARAAAGADRVGLEAASVTWAEQRELAPRLGGEPVATDGLVEGLRARKDEGEIARIAAAAAIADAALAAVRPLLGERPTERDIAIELDAEMGRRGAEAPAFDTIVASGPNGARPHHRPGARRIVAGDLVVIDFGATVDGYRSDMSRTFAVGGVGPTQSRMLAVVGEAQAAGLAAVARGATAGAVDAACREVIAAAGWDDAFVHPTGHGVGLEIHERLRLAPGATATLEDGHVVTVEPGVYLAPHGGVRVEDTVVVTADGCRPVTRASKDPVA